MCFLGGGGSFYLRICRGGGSIVPLGHRTGGGGGTQSRKGYRLWPDCWGAVAVASKNC